MLSAMYQLNKHLIFAILILLLLPPVYAAPQTKEECMRAAKIEHKVNLSAGVYTEKAQVTTPLHINLPATIDDKTYFECLVRNQLIDHESTEKYLAKQDECRSQTRLLKVENNNGRTRIGKSADVKTFDACMDSDIGVEVLAPTN